MSLNNPLGGIARGLDEIREIYRRIFERPARVWVELHDVVEYVAGASVVFAGRERGEFARDGRTPVPLAIRTSRLFQYCVPVRNRESRVPKFVARVALPVRRITLLLSATMAALYAMVQLSVALATATFGTATGS